MKMKKLRTITFITKQIIKMLQHTIAINRNMLQGFTVTPFLVNMHRAQGIKLSR